MKATKLLVLAALAIGLSTSNWATQAAPQTGASQARPTSRKSVEPTVAPSSQEITDAKAKGLVWVNTSTHVYHEDRSFYGTTKHGKFMAEEDAKQAGYRAARPPGASKVAKTSGPANKEAA